MFLILHYVIACPFQNLKKHANKNNRSLLVKHQSDEVCALYGYI